MQTDDSQSSRLEVVPLNRSEAMGSKREPIGTNYSTEGDLILSLHRSLRPLFVTPTHPERLLFLDIETFYPWDGSYSQPADTIPGSLLRPAE